MNLSTDQRQKGAGKSFIKTTGFRPTQNKAPWRKAERRIRPGQTHRMGENAWLIIKHKDEFATGEDVKKQDKSALSGKTIEAMAKTIEKIWQHGYEEDVVPDQELEEEVETTEPETTKADVAKIVKSAPK